MRMLTGLAGGLLLVLLAAGTACAEGAGIDWKTSYDEALKAGKAGNKLILVDFYTDW